MKRILLVTILAAGCGFTQPVPKGEGSWSKPAQERVKAESYQAFFARVASKAAFAASHPQDLQANREAVDMTRQAAILSLDSTTARSMVPWQYDVGRMV